MDQNPNFTPVELENQKPELPHKKSGLNLVITSIGAFVFALIVITAFFIFKQLSSPQTINTKAESSTSCNTQILNPTNTQAFVVTDGVETEIQKGDLIQSGSITFKWEPVPEAKQYYILVTSDPKGAKGYIDPAVKGIATQTPSYEFSDLKPQTTYYVLIRSHGKNGELGLIFPDKKNCKFLLPAENIFEFKTE